MKGEDMALLMNPAIKQISEAGDRIKAQNVVTQVAIALERFRIVHGEYPETLEPLVPQFLDALPSDPFSQQPLVYRLDKDGSFQLYSIGPNRKDDGGIALDEGTYPDVDLTAIPKIRTVKDWIKQNKKE
jgi:hypothetical protein